MNCHGSATHPVDLDYAAAAARSHGSLRTSDEAVRRGAFLPAGQVKCVTCHDPRSPWKYKLALPPGARAVAAVDRSDATTYETPRSKRSPAAPAPGAAVSPTPLCTTCHAYGD